uniref:ESF1 homolog n=1 Tax=Cacopsylla melanoneura TaxID=428564 RepID=A0A8D8S234_9HEMI
MGSQDEDDERFKHIGKDPKFKRIPYETRKVKIDKRFQSMFKDEKFKVKYDVDKRGFPIKPQTNADDFKKFYNLDTKDNKDKESSSEEEEDDDDDDEVRGGESDASVDIARGIGVQNNMDSSSDEESSEEEVDEEDKFKHEWGELDQDAERTEETTHRLAVMHMDWDRIKAKDLMVLFNSFLPQGGSIESVNIYPSEFGKQRMAEEEVKGPLELVEHSEESEGEEDEQSTEGSSYHREKLRQYQLNRLKYYYAVVIFDSAESANKVYTECDNMEYESSATRVDLRFIPDDTQFDEEPKESCTELPDLSKYKPRHFMNSALQQVKVNLTWDETDPDRVEAVSRLMSGDVDEHNLKTYLATSSEEEDDAHEGEEEVGADEASDDSAPNEPSHTKESKQDVINKYRALLKSINEDEAGKKNDVEMEISWGVGLEDRTKELMKEKKQKDLTPFQKLLEKKKEKRKKKREEKQKSEKKEDGEADDDIPSDIDMNDPYFKEEVDAMKKTNKKSKQQVGNNRLEEEEVEDSSGDDNDEANAQANLELLLMDDKQLGNTVDKHFSMKKIEEREKEMDGGKKKKKKSMKNYRKKKMEEKKAKEDEDMQDGFKVDVIDSRFNAVYTSHHYNIDPADPHFHRTQAMQAIIEEKQKRRRQADNEPVPEVRPKKKR